MLVATKNEDLHNRAGHLLSLILFATFLLQAGGVWAGGQSDKTAPSTPGTPTVAATLYNGVYYTNNTHVMISWCSSPACLSTTCRARLPLFARN